MSLAANILLLAGAYLLGSFPYMYLLLRARGIAVELHEDFHLVLWRRVGRMQAISGILLDAAKGAIPLLVGFYAGFDIAIIVFSGVLAALGQMWPVFLSFNGEKGNTTGMGIVVTYGALYENYTVVIVSLGIILIGFLVRTVPRLLSRGQSLNEKMKLGGPASNSFPLAMIVTFAVIPLVLWWTGESVVVILAFVVLFLAIVIRRITAGLRSDFKAPDASKTRIVLARLLFDRGEWESSYQYYQAPDSNESGK